MSAKHNNPSNPAWAFAANHTYFWASAEKGFTKDECAEIISLGSRLISERAITIGGADDLRDSEIAWIHPSEESNWLYQRMTELVLNINEQFFKFDLFGLLEGIQFTKYSAPAGRYGKHVDSWVKGPVRKLSFTLQLSDPQEYEGGELRLYFKDDPEVMPKPQGAITLFPSYVLHEVTPVTKGTRYSLVAWVTGKPFV